MNSHILGQCILYGTKLCLIKVADAAGKTTTGERKWKER
jgi:hypothetical protein